MWIKIHAVLDRAIFRTNEGGHFMEHALIKSAPMDRFLKNRIYYKSKI